MECSLVLKDNKEIRKEKNYRPPTNTYNSNKIKTIKTIFNFYNLEKSFHTNTSGIRHFRSYNFGCVVK